MVLLEYSKRRFVLDPWEEFIEAPHGYLKLAECTGPRQAEGVLGKL